MWPMTPLKELAEINPKWETETDPRTLVSFVPMKSIGAMSGEIDASQAVPLSETKKGLTRFCEGDVLLAKITPSMENGKVAVARSLANGLGVGTTEFHVLRPKSVNPKFLMYYFFQDSVREDLRRHMKGTAGQLRVPASYLSGLQVPKPSIEEQESTVEEIDKQFTRLDAALKSLYQARAKLARHRKALLTRAATGTLFDEKEIGEVQDDELSELPSGWRWVPLGELILSLKNGVFVSRPKKEPPGVPILRISAVRPMSLDISDIRYAPESGAYEGYFVAPGELLFTRYSGNPEYVGACALVRELPSPVLHPDKLIRVRVRSDEVLPAFIEIVASVGVSRRMIERRSKTTAGQTGISGSDLKSILIPLAPVDEQDRIVAEVERQLSISEQLHASVESALRRAQLLRQSILTAAFSGKLLDGKSALTELSA